MVLLLSLINNSIIPINYPLFAGPDIDALTKELLKSDSTGLMECTKLFILDVADTNAFMPGNYTFGAKPHSQQDEPVFLATKLNNHGIAKVVRLQVRCLTTIISTDFYNMKDLVSLSKVTQDHVIFKLGGRKPRGAELKMPDRPVVWIEEASMVRLCFQFAQIASQKK